jgi:ligand-binding sensor protein
VITYKEKNMHLQRIVSKAKFRLLSGNYTTQTGLPLILINTDGEIIHGVRKCTVCKQALAGVNSILMNNCQLKMLNAIEEAFRWGQEYITNCPLGLIMFAVPIILDRELIGGFISGFAIFPIMRQDFVDEIAQNLKGFCETLDEAKLPDLEIRIISRKKVRDDVSYLLALTGQFQINDLSVLEERKAKYIQQYKIANYLDDLKKEQARYCEENSGQTGRDHPESQTR